MKDEFVPFEDDFIPSRQARVIIAHLINSAYISNTCYNTPVMNQKHIEIKKLVKYYGKARGVTDVSFDVNQADFFGFIGPNGAGKSTLFSIVCGFLTPTKGLITFNGDDLTKYSIKERGDKIGFVMQNPNHMISKPFVMEEVALGLSVRGVSEEQIKLRCEEVLKICELWPYRNWPINALSYGMKKRVTIASILTMNPEILILDEPTAGQDLARYTEIMEFLKKLNEEQGITIIMITHDMHLMLEYTKRAIVLSDGHIIADKTPAQILTDSAITDKAYLKTTSLHNLALRLGFEDTIAFANRFIQYEEDRKNA